MSESHEIRADRQKRATAGEPLAVECQHIEDAIFLKQRLARYAADLAHKDPVTSATLAFVLRCGQPYFVDERSFSEPRGEPSKCITNAAIEALNCPERTYVEGYFMLPGYQTYHHAWTASPDGRLHELTLTERYRPIAYYGVPFTVHYVRHSILANERYGMLSSKARNTLPDLLEGTATDWYRHDDPEKLSHDTARMRSAVQRSLIFAL